MAGGRLRCRRGGQRLPCRPSPEDAYPPTAAQPRPRGVQELEDSAQAARSSGGRPMYHHMTDLPPWPPVLTQGANTAI